MLIRRRIVLCMSIVVGLIVAGAGGGANAGTRRAAVTSGTQSKPVLMTAAALGQYARSSRQRIYWAGPEAGMTYEFRKTVNGRIFVRYLPTGAKAGTLIAYRTVGTYPTLHAFSVLQGQARVTGWARVPGGTHMIAVYQRTHPTSVYVAFTGSNYELEVYDPTPGAAIALVRAGRIRPIT